MADDDSSFFTRWSRRKVQARGAEPLLVVALAPELPVPAIDVAVPAQPLQPSPPADPALVAVAPDAPPALTLTDVAQLTRDSDYTAFVVRGVAPEVKNAALKKLFTDPHFNVMDGLDTYIDDYGKPDPLPPGMLRQMVQSKLLGLFDDEVESDPAATDQPAPAATAADSTAAAALSEAPPDTPTAHEDPALQLQPDDDAGRAGPEPGAGEDAGRQHGRAADGAHAAVPP